MRYIISDIHGCKKQYLELLEKIKFSDQDHLYILGDSVDRGEQSIEVLRYIMKQKNVTYIIGNHDYILFLFIQKLGLNLDNFENDEIKWSFKFWLYDGGLTTLNEFLELSEYERNAGAKYASDRECKESHGRAGYHSDHYSDQRRY